MIVRAKAEAKVVDWGNGLSYRFLLEPDRMGFTVAHTVVRAGTSSQLQYSRHLEACYCIAGQGRIATADGSLSWPLEAGVIYALDQHDAHVLIADEGSDVELISVFNPPLQGDERHNLGAEGFSQY